MMQKLSFVCAAALLRKANLFGALVEKMHFLV